MRPPTPIRLVPIALLSLLISLPAAADWQQAFRLGVRAYEKGQWSVAAGWMQQALAENPRASAETVNINGGFNVAYTPSQYLAASMANLGNCDAAQSALHDAQGTAPGGDALVRTAKKKCPSIDTSSGPSAAEIAAAKEQAARDQAAKEQAARDQAAKDKAAKDAQAQIAAKEQSARDQAAREQAARDQAARDQKNRDAAAQQAAAQAAKEQAAREEAAKVAAAQQEAARIEDLKRSLNARMLEAKGMLAGNAGNAKTRAVLQDSVNNATRALTVATLTELDGASQRLGKAVDSVLKSSGGTDEGRLRLKLAVQAYLRGDYKATMQTLDGGAFVDAALRAQAALFKAAAKYADLILSGDKDAKSKITAEVAEYRRLRGGPPDARLFSPAFRQIVTAQ